MIVFHEGLPGAGKSYEAVLTFVVPALRDGKHVYTNIRGLDAVAIAKYLGIAPVFLEERIHTTSPDAEPDEHDGAHLERQKAFFLSAGANCLILWDEIQDFFPSTRQKLPDQWIEFVSQHRHLARDIVLMGQDVRDCHSIWKRRVEQLVRFRKLSMIGKGNGYRWEIFTNKGGDKWESIDSGFRKYDPKVFALYQSIRHEAAGHALLSHDKARPFANSWFLKYGLPAFCIALVWGVFTIWDIFAGDAFTGGQHVAAEDGPAAVAAPAAADLPAGAALPPPAGPLPVDRTLPVDGTAPLTPAKPGGSSGNLGVPDRPASDRPGQTGATLGGDWLVQRLEDGKAYVLGIVQGNADSDAWHVDVVLYDSSGQPYLRLNRDALQVLAKQVSPHPVGLRLITNDGKERFIPFRAAPENASTTVGAVDYYRRTAGIVPAQPTAGSLR